MIRLDVWRFAAAAALTFSILYTVCTLTIALYPEGSVTFFNSWFHELDLLLLRPQGSRPLTLSGFLHGGAGVAVVSFGVSATLAAFYNAFTRGNEGH